jgi:tRNA A-37 threonylcarbamoyl transferase component Bud32
MKDLVVGQVLGRYELLLPIAKGGMAQVWAARLRGTRGFQKIVAIKTILPGAMDDDRMERMFLEEATLASQIHHPNVVGTLELGEDEGMLYLVMEWVEGESLSLIVNRSSERGGMPLPIAVNLIGQACKGLHAAHELRDESGAPLGVVHRDISAHNVLVTYSGNAKLVDFGIAKATARSSGLTEAGEIKGKFAYLAPEQALAQSVDRRTDIFAMGILLYLLTTGRHPFKAASPGETLQNIISSTPPASPSKIVPGYPAELEAVVLKALSKAPDDRWATANDMLSALERAMPQCLDGSFEVKVAKYMGHLLGNRAHERRTELRLAHQMLDKLRADGLPVDAMMGSSGSLRAMSVDPTATTPAGGSQSQGKIAVEMPSGVAVVEASRRTPVFNRRRLLTIGMAVAGLVLLVLLRQSRHRGDGERAAAATGPVPNEAAKAPPTEAEPPIAGKIVPTAPSPAAVHILGDDNKDGASARARKPTAAPPHTNASGPAAIAPSSPRAAPSGRARSDAADGVPNAWDPGTFGGRR